MSTVIKTQGVEYKKKEAASARKSNKSERVAADGASSGTLGALEEVVAEAESLPLESEARQTPLSSAPAQVAGAILEILRRSQSSYESSHTPGTICVYGEVLHNLAFEEVRNLSEGQREDEHGSIGIVAALLAGAIALDSGQSPVCVQRRAWMKQAYGVAYSADISFGFCEEPCEALIKGINAGRSISALDAFEPVKAVERAEKAQAVDAQSEDESNQAVGPEPAAFDQGRDLAVAMVRAGESHWGTDDCEPAKQVRNGIPLCMFAEQYLQALIQSPSCLPGFAAVLSAKLGVGDVLRSEDLELSSDEYGLNDCQVGASRNLTIAHAVVSSNACGDQRTAGADRWNDQEWVDLGRALDEAIAIMIDRSEEADSDHVYASIYAAERSRELLVSGQGSKSFRACEQAGGPMGVAQAVLDTAIERFEDPSLRGARRLLGIAKMRLDAEVGRCLQKEAN